MAVFARDLLIIGAREQVVNGAQLLQHVAYHGLAMVKLQKFHCNGGEIPISFSHMTILLLSPPLRIGT